jgi:hypothetical protein
MGPDKDAAVEARRRHGLPVDLGLSEGGGDAAPPHKKNDNREMRSMADDLSHVNGKLLWSEAHKRLRGWIGTGVGGSRGRGDAAVGAPGSTYSRWVPRRGAVRLHRNNSIGRLIDLSTAFCVSVGERCIVFLNDGQGTTRYKCRKSPDFPLSVLNNNKKTLCYGGNFIMESLHGHFLKRFSTESSLFH